VLGNSGRDVAVAGDEGSGQHGRTPYAPRGQGDRAHAAAAAAADLKGAVQGGGGEAAGGAAGGRAAYGAPARMQAAEPRGPRQHSQRRQRKKQRHLLQGSGGSPGSKQDASGATARRGHALGHAGDATGATQRATPLTAATETGAALRQQTQRRRGDGGIACHRLKSRDRDARANARKGTAAAHAALSKPRGVGLC
jgi:hypothetical protein